VIAEDEQVPSEGHGGRISLNREYRVIEAVPIADKWVDKIENQSEGNQRRRQPPSPGAPEGNSASQETGL